MVWTENDEFEIDNADSGELLYELGLRDGDILVEINGFSMGSTADLMAAYVNLWIVQGEVSYELDIIRDETPITLYYELVATL